MHRAAAFTASLATCAALALPGPAAAQGADYAALSRALELEAIIDVMRTEGIDYALELEDEIFPGRGGEAWAGEVAAIYDADAMLGALEAGLETTLPARFVPDVTAFFESEPGQSIIRLEVSAREAMMDEAIESAALEMWERQRDADAPRLDLIERYVEANDLLDRNVAGALTYNYAFMSGLSEGGAFDFTLTDEDILADVWGQEETVRVSTEEWLYSFLTTAYQPLSDAEIETYIAFSESDAGRALNAALFNAFDEVFTTISRELGYRAADYLKQQDI